MRIAVTLALSLLVSVARAEPDPRLDPRLAPPAPPALDERAISPTAPVPRLRLKLDTTLSDPGPMLESHSLQPSDAILAPAEAAAFETDETIDPAGPATRK